jgi:ribosomal protein S18 acetylase RimI-like enzyme
MRIFRSNMPRFFTRSEEGDFAGWLDALDGPLGKEDEDDVAYYYVGELQGSVIACGGWGIRTGADHATLIWGMVDAAHHGSGIGRALTRHRLDDFGAAYPSMDMTIDTSHHTEGFYERLGFQTEKITEDGYAPGLHRHDMRLKATSGAE